MAFSYLTLFTALVISLGAAIYSIIGLTAIFAAAFWPIVIMGSSLEVGKIVTTLWLHKYWARVELQYKLYLSAAVVILMVLTSMGVFGFLSKAHLDQAVPSGDVQAQVQIFDDKIKTQQDNIKAARAALTQMDSAVDQTMSRSTTEQGADKAANLRRSQARERGTLQNDIARAQKEITTLQEQRAPIASQARVLEAEVGPIKYIAALIYGDNPEANVLEKAVRWVIILIVIVFDPLAIVLLLAATKSLRWERDALLAKRPEEDNEPEYEPDDGPLTDDQVDHIRQYAQSHLPTGPVQSKSSLFDEDLGRWDDFFNGTKSFQEIERGPQVNTVREELVPDPLPVKDAKEPSTPGWMFVDPPKPVPDPVVEPAVLETVVAPVVAPPEVDHDDITKLARQVYAAEHPDEDLDQLDRDMAAGKITVMPWHNEDHIESLPISDGERARLKQQMLPQADNVPPVLGTVTGFGTAFPTTANRGDLFLRVDALPTVLYKYNGTQWIEVDKTMTDSYAHDAAYIEHLIDKIGTGQYDPDLLSDAEREQIAIKLKNNL
jgi:hypothetical protein